MIEFTLELAPLAEKIATQHFEAQREMVVSLIFEVGVFRERGASADEIKELTTRLDEAAASYAVYKQRLDGVREAIRGAEAERMKKIEAIMRGPA